MTDLVMIVGTVAPFFICLASARLWGWPGTAAGLSPALIGVVMTFVTLNRPTYAAFAWTLVAATWFSVGGVGAAVGLHARRLSQRALVIGAPP